VRDAVPHGGEYPSGVPSRFVAEPTNVYLPGGSGRHCTDQTAAFPARWPTGLAVMPSNPSDLLVTYSEVCVTRPPGGAPSIDTEGWGYLLFNWRTRHVDHGPVDVFRPKRNAKAISDSLLFESPQFDNGRLVLFSSTCAAALVSCRTGTVWSTTVAPTTAALDNPRRTSRPPSPPTVRRRGRRCRSPSHSSRRDGDSSRRRRSRAGTRSIRRQRSPGRGTSCGRGHCPDARAASPSASGYRAIPSSARRPVSSCRTRTPIPVPAATSWSARSPTDRTCGAGRRSLGARSRVSSQRARTITSSSG